MATKAAARGHLSKKELKQDKLVEWTYRLENLYHEKKNLVLGIGVGILVAIAAVILISRSMQSAKVEQSFDLSVAKTAYGLGNMEQAKSGFESVVSKHSGAAAGEANYFLGRIAFEQGDLATAQSRFEAYLKDSAVDRFMDASAWSGLAAVKEAQSDLAGAAAAYEKIAKDFADLPCAAQSLAEASRIYLKQNQKDKAISALQTLRAKYPESTLAAQAKRDLDNLQ